jgi:hypothetical protein
LRREAARCNREYAQMIGSLYRPVHDAAYERSFCRAVGGLKGTVFAITSFFGLVLIICLLKIF